MLDKLDQLFTNTSDTLINSGVVEPIEDDRGVTSDHAVVHASVRMPRVPQYQVQQYEYYSYWMDGEIKFGS